MSSTEKNRLCLCADDYGLHQSINAAILHLAQIGRLNAISCMTNMPAWEMPQQLANLPDIALGLHLNLPYTTLGKFIVNNYLHRLGPQPIQQAFSDQLHLFQDSVGRQPDFIDGHQHVHQFPQVRKILLDFYLQHFPDKQVIVRNTVNHLRTLKGISLNILGGLTWRRLLTQQHIPTNCNFSGIYSLNRTDYPTIFATLISKLTQPTLFMCHPGQAITHHDQFRQREYDFFASQQFQDILNQYQISLQPIRAVL